MKILLSYNEALTITQNFEKIEENKSMGYDAEFGFRFKNSFIQSSGDQVEELPKQIPCEIQEKPHRSYYKDDWRCWCKNHTVEDYIKYLNAVFHTKSAHYSNNADWKGEKRECYHVETNADCLLMNDIRTVEFHGLMLSSMFANGKGKFSFLFEPFGWYK